MIMAKRADKAEGIREKGKGKKQEAIGNEEGVPQQTPSPVGDSPLTGGEQDEAGNIATSNINLDPKVLYEFPSHPVCPRCGTRDNRAVSTQGQVQYRKCQRATCRWRWKVVGVEVAVDSKQ